MSDLSPKTKMIIGLLLFIIAIPLIITGIVYLIVIAIDNIWGWMFIFFGVLLVALLITLISKISGEPPRVIEYETD